MAQAAPHTEGSGNTMKIENRLFHVSIPTADGKSIAELIPIKIPMEWDADTQEWLMTAEGLQKIEEIEARHAGLPPSKMRLLQQQQTHIKNTHKINTKLINESLPLWTKFGEPIVGTYDNLNACGGISAYNPFTEELDQHGSANVFWDKQDAVRLPAIGGLPPTFKFMDEDGDFYYIEDLLIGETFETAKLVLEYSGPDRDTLLMSSVTGSPLAIDSAEITVHIKWAAGDLNPITSDEANKLSAFAIQRIYKAQKDDVKAKTGRMNIEMVDSSRRFLGTWAVSHSRNTPSSLFTRTRGHTAQRNISPRLRCSIARIIRTMW